MTIQLKTFCAVLSWYCLYFNFAQNRIWDFFKILNPLCHPLEWTGSVLSVSGSYNCDVDYKATVKRFALSSAVANRG